jgi:hypothetical protein
VTPTVLLGKLFPTFRNIAEQLLQDEAELRQAKETIIIIIRLSLQKFIQ